MYILKRLHVLKYYEDFQETQWLSYSILKNQQEMQLRKLVHFAYQNVPYYTKLFDKLKLKPSDINTIKDLENLPVLTKEIIKKNWEDFIPINLNKYGYINNSTGGSTGNPLKYRMSLEDYERGIALLYRGWGYAGYKLGNKVAVIAGSSLIPITSSKIKREFKIFLLNTRHYSSFDMSEKKLFDYLKDINNWKPDFIRGYASSLYLFAKFIKDNNLTFNFKPKGIFSTAEKLFDKQRKLIEQVVNAKVFDNYGLNEGGVSAYECEKHNGFHIDMERSILEVVDNKGQQVVDKEGKILATSLYNYALPFIRYDTGDLGVISDLECTCGRKMPLLENFLKLNNVIIGSPVLTVLMGKLDIEQYQIIQTNASSITCKIVKGDTYDEKKDEEFIKESFYRHVGKINIEFSYVNVISAVGGSKFKFIINNFKEH